MVLIQRGCLLDLLDINTSNLTNLTNDVFTKPNAWLYYPSLDDVRLDAAFAPLIIGF